MVEQLPLIPAADEQPSPGAAQPPELTPEATLQTTIKAFAGHMERVDFSENTIKSFLWDLSLLERYLDKRTPIGAIGTKELRDFMEYLRHGRGVPCTVKSYARRLTTLKVFFGWLAEESILPRDPAAPLIHEPATSPLPAILYDEQVERALEAAQALSHDAKSPDPRPLLLLNLILQMKKGVHGLELRHFDFRPQSPPYIALQKGNSTRAQAALSPLSLSVPARLEATSISVFSCTADPSTLPKPSSRAWRGSLQIYAGLRGEFKNNSRTHRAATLSEIAGKT